MEVELILLVVIGLVFAFDFILKGLKRSSKKDEVVTHTKNSSASNVPKIYNKIFQYIIERPRNIGLYFFSASVLKVLINYFIYPTKYKRYYDYDKPLRRGEKNYFLIDESFNYYIKNFFNYQSDNLSQFILMWLMSFSIISFIA